MKTGGHSHERFSDARLAIVLGDVGRVKALAFGRLASDPLQSPCAPAPLRETISRTYDALGRNMGLGVADVAGSPATYAVEYGYDAYGCFASIASSGNTYSYSYLPGSSLVSGMTASTGHAWTRSYEPQRNLIAAVENTYGSAVVSRFDYANDEIGRRVSRADSGIAFDNPAFDKYTYNTRSEVIGAQRYHGTDVSDTSKVYGGRGFGYNYDPIGNRTTATEIIGGETLAKSYTANALNQYTTIANPDAVGLRGSATNTATVTVNGNAASCDNIASDTVPWHFALHADNANEGKYTFASIMAVVNQPGTNTPDIVSTASGTVYAPPQQEVLVYDDDGNLVSDGRWHYTWNGENRLIKAEEQVCPTNRQPYVVEYTYDHRGRMIWKTVASSNAPPSMASRYLWDDYNIIAETVAQDTATNTTYNIWGLDLDGTLQGAGGVGGLLAVVKDSATYVPAWDANGNIMEYVAEDGTIAVHREYDPFGGTVVATGDANAFTHWFSTKPWCPATGLGEYQYRKYSPVLGRWMSRDPAEESSSNNLLAFCDNACITLVDYLGQSLLDPSSWFSKKATCCNNSAYDSREYCCCKNCIDTPGATGADLVSRNKVDTGVAYYCRRTRWYHIPIYRPWAPDQLFLQHCWLSIDGGRYRAGAYPIRGNNPGSIIPEKSDYYDTEGDFWTVESRVELSPCEYDIERFRYFVEHYMRHDSFQWTLYNNCRDWVLEVIAISKDFAKGSCLKYP
jgi:RHS repeat-associated protein